MRVRAGSSLPPVCFLLSAGQTYVLSLTESKQVESFLKSLFFLKEQRQYFIHLPTLSSQFFASQVLAAGIYSKSLKI